MARTCSSPAFLGCFQPLRWHAAVSRLVTSEEHRATPRFAVPSLADVGRRSVRRLRQLCCLVQLGRSEKPTVSAACLLWKLQQWRSSGFNGSQRISRSTFSFGGILGSPCCAEMKNAWLKHHAPQPSPRESFLVAIWLCLSKPQWDPILVGR